MYKDTVCEEGCVPLVVLETEGIDALDVENEQFAFLRFVCGYRPWPVSRICFAQPVPIMLKWAHMVLFLCYIY